MRNFGKEKIINKFQNKIKNDRNNKILAELNISNKLEFNLIDFENNNKEIFNIRKIISFREKRIKEEILNIKDNKLKEKEKRLYILDKINTSD